MVSRVIRLTDTVFSDSNFLAGDGASSLGMAADGDTASRRSNRIFVRISPKMTVAIVPLTLSIVPTDCKPLMRTVAPTPTTGDALPTADTEEPSTGGRPAAASCSCSC